MDAEKMKHNFKDLAKQLKPLQNTLSQLDKDFQSIIMNSTDEEKKKHIDKIKNIDELKEKANRDAEEIIGRYNKYSDEL